MKFLGLTLVLMAFAGSACASEWSGFYALRGGDTNSAKTASPHIRVRVGVETLFKIQERVRMPTQIDLHAPDVDRPHTGS